MAATLLSTSYRMLSLVQGGLEIPCLVSVSILETKKKGIIAKNKDVVHVLSLESDDWAPLGCFLHHIVNISSNIWGYLG